MCTRVPFARATRAFGHEAPNIRAALPKPLPILASSRRIGVEVSAERIPSTSAFLGFDPPFPQTQMEQQQEDPSPAPRNYQEPLPSTVKKIHTEVRSPSAMIESVHHPATGTWQYVVADKHSMDAIIIDPVLDYDMATHTISTNTADRLRSLIEAKGYRIQRILETHVHADHPTAASYLQSVLEQDQGFKPPVCIGKRIREIQRMFGQRYGVAEHEMSSAFDQLMDDDEEFSIGDLKAKVVHLPGHTPDHVGYLIEGSYRQG